MTDSNKPDNKSIKKHIQTKPSIKQLPSSHGGKREGSGRPKGTGKYGEPTKAIRVPVGSVTQIKHFIAYEYNATDNKTENTLTKNTKQLDESNVVILANAKDNNFENKQEFPLFSSKVAAGLPSYADDDLDDSIDLNDYLVQKPNSTFMLKVQGMSMRDAGILPDDILIVDRSERATHNKIVIAALDGELTVKRLYRRGDLVKLLPENPDYPEIIIREESQLVIWGVVVGSFRRFEATKFS